MPDRVLRQRAWRLSIKLPPAHSPHTPSARAVAKSAFGLYALFRAIKMGRTVVYDSDKGGFAVFKGGGAYTRALGVAGLSELRDSSALYISDGKPPVESNAFTLLVSSPKRAVWSKFSQSPGHPQLLLPPMKEEEILELRRLAFSGMPGCDEAAVQRRFDRWGGSARNVLTYGWNEMWQVQLEEAPSKLSLDKLKDALSTSSSFDCAAYEEFIHLIPKGALEGATLAPSDSRFYMFGHAQLSTRYVTDKVAAKMKATNNKEFKSFLFLSRSDPTGNARFQQALH